MIYVTDNISNAPLTKTTHIDNIRTDT